MPFSHVSSLSIFSTEELSFARCISYFKESDVWCQQGIHLFNDTDVFSSTIG